MRLGVSSLRFRVLEYFGLSVSALEAFGTKRGKPWPGCLTSLERLSKLKVQRPLQVAMAA